MLDFRTLWDRARPYPDFLAASTKHKGLWEGIYAIARLPAWATGATHSQWLSTVMDNLWKYSVT